ncbi:3198_t:CDS:1 [Dentiscutata erythropus]|uniref:3198_t:CDS:1 n=1 Tax=Dentiscutata erythropus TaxID=1348616 RepID=A0A9N9NS38_9GLOM|nr:3198_t:CDS:1 [Dentiscutata erythropus]
MNKQIIFYFLIALVVLTFIIEVYSTPVIYKFNNDKKLDFLTPEKMKNAKPLTTRNLGFKTRSTKIKRNTTDSSKNTKSIPPLEKKISLADVDQQQNIPIGKLFIHNQEGDLFTCTASVINTQPEGDGNIGITAAHCLYNFTTQTYYNNIYFSPGYDNGQPQPNPLSAISVDLTAVTVEFINNNDDHFDWALIKFDFNLNGQPLQYYTGSLGWALNVGDNIPTTIRGYPNEGQLPNCPNDGEHLCTWQGTPNLADYYLIPDLEIGEGASGSPLIMNYDPNTNLGTLYSNYASFDEIEEEALSPIYDPIEFQALLDEITRG